ncbi:MAG: prolyl oligopeptidase family serine peptidase [Spirochaetes bacterium]|nr:prolyl oligopeptidase family serine peptidase [Spirochaetota bacterium]
MKKIFFLTAVLITSCFLSCSKKPQDRNTDIIERSLKTLNDKKISETDEATLILKRYQYYLTQLKKGNAYVDWRENSNPPVYNPTVFLRMMDKMIISELVNNSVKGRDAFDGITGFFERAYISEVDQTIDSYIIYVPHKFDPSKNYPLIVLLHGHGDSSLFNPYSPANFELLKACEKNEVILIAPCGRQKQPALKGLYIDDAETDVLQVISLVKKHYPINDKKVYLTGLSMGGFGTYWIGGRHADLFAAIAPVCGLWTGIFGYPKADLDLLKNMPVYIFHNDMDKIVPVSESRSAYAYLKKAGVYVKYKEYKINKNDLWDYGMFEGHNAWDYAYKDTMLVEWLLQYEKK